MIQKRLAGLLLAFLFLEFVRVPMSGAIEAYAPLPRVPCEAGAFPGLPALDAPPVAEIWTGATLRDRWIPPACTGWQAAHATLMVALTGHFTNSRDLGAMLAHIGMISALHEVRYWSVTDKQWNALFTRAIGLSGPDSSTPRGDFSSAEFRKGSELYFLSSDNRLQKEIVTRLRVRDMGTESVVLEMTNVSPLRWFTFTMVPAGDMQTLYFLNRRADSSWQFYSLTRVLNGSFLLPHLVSNPSYVNRAVAMYRYIAGIPTDLAPPAMP
jgi:hypothetical protein